MGKVNDPTDAVGDREDVDCTDEGREKERRKKGESCMNFRVCRKEWLRER